MIASWRCWYREVELAYNRKARHILWLAAFTTAMAVPPLMIATRWAADVLCSLTALLFLAHSLLHGSWQWTRDPVIRLGLVSWLWMISAVSLFAHNPQASAGVSLAWVRYLMLYAALRHWVLTRTDAILLFNGVLALLLGWIAVDTLWQYIYGISLSGQPIELNDRLSGPFTNIKVGIYLAKLWLPTAAVCFYYALMKRWRALAWATAAGSLLCVAVIMFSGERTAFGSTLLALCVAMALLAIGEPRLRRILLIIALAFSAFVLLSLATQDWVRLRASQFYEVMEDIPSSAYGRLFVAAYEIGLAHWPTGGGLKSFRALCPDFIRDGVEQHCNLHPHNPYMEYFAETGLPGLLLFIGIALALMREGWRIFQSTRGLPRLLPAAALGAWMVHFFPFMPTQSVFSNWPAILLWYALGLTFGSQNLVKCKVSP